jgi:hypothetical protein
MDFTLDQQQYEALIFLAREGAKATGRVQELEQWLKIIEKANGVSRSFVLVQWQEAGEPLPPGTFFPSVWPPDKRASVELTTRPVSRADVDALLASHAKQPMTVLVTRDPQGLVGWTPLDDFFPT